MSVKAKGCAAGLLLGSILKALVTLLGLLAKALASILWYTGLWVPGVYALFGFVLYLGWHFNPLDGGLYPTLYLIGFGLTVFIFVIIFVRNLFVKPFKSVAEGFRNPVWSRKKGDEDEDKKKVKEEDEDEKEWRKTQLEHKRKKALRRTRKADALRLAGAASGGDDTSVIAKDEHTGCSDDIYGYRNPAKKESAVVSYAYEERGEEPKIYLSAVEKDTLVHEYSDRFEVYDLDGGKKTLRTVEYKGDRR